MTKTMSDRQKTKAFPKFFKHILKCKRQLPSPIGYNEKEVRLRMFDTLNYLKERTIFK